ncbi:serine protease 1-like [Adelges cooleyi]|uniref:serine protease 1-like n=1 Tax=Adelges cooleyi TaxID=133065 RepID=UPI00217FCFB9|nr:serine protease 1-like [Adelges cooleyi]
MWKILFYIVVLAAVAKASPQSSDDLTLEDITEVNFFNKIGMLVSKYKLELNNLRGTISGKLLQISKLLNLYNPKCPPCSCGALGSDLKIIDGKEVNYAHKYPWMASVLQNDEFHCGASLINDKYVLTAGHCVETLKASDYKVRLSVHDRNTDISEEYNAKRIIRHERYTKYGGAPSHDIALIRLDTDGVKINNDVHPVCMPEKGLSYANAVGTITGWGKTHRHYLDPTDVLREAQLYVLSNSECEPSFYGLITPNMVCAGLIDEGTTCNMDSGGPLTVVNGSVHHLIGITSFGMSGCRPPPAVYTRVSEYLDWIKANTEDACPCRDNYAEKML